MKVIVDAYCREYAAMMYERAMVFREVVYAPAYSYTVSTLDEFLAKYDELAVHAVVDDIDAPDGDFLIEAQASADGQHWDAPFYVTGGTVFSGLPYNPFAGAIKNTVAFLRLRMRLRAPTTRGQVSIFVTGRDSGAWEEVAEEVRLRKEAERAIKGHSAAEPDPLVLGVLYAPPLVLSHIAVPSYVPPNWVPHQPQPILPDVTFTQPSPLLQAPFHASDGDDDD